MRNLKEQTRPQLPGQNKSKLHDNLAVTVGVGLLWNFYGEVWNLTLKDSELARLQHCNTSMTSRIKIVSLNLVYTVLCHRATDSWNWTGPVGRAINLPSVILFLMLTLTLTDYDSDF